jgi:diguanylate cyclase (GGDEF)-like protein/PAS domain S-box-containing protein
LQPDVILSDFALPGFGGMAALQIARQHRPDTPFIFVSGTIGEERAIEALKQGAIDYVLKDNRARLVPAIRRALAEGDERRARRRAEEAQREATRLMNGIIESALDCILAIDHEGKILEFNPAAEVMFGRTREAVLGQPMAELIIPSRFRTAHHRGFSHYLATGEDTILGKRLELTAMRADGTEFPVELAITPILSRAVPIFVGHIRDISERKKAEERLVYLAQYDALTGLPNRQLFREQLSLAIARAKRSGHMLALMFLDLDRFKEINDTLGHATGDLLLQAIARLLRRSLRDADSIARLGGDEFTIILEDITDVDQVIAVAEKVKAAFSDAIVIEGRDLFVTASIGISMDVGGSDIDTLVQTADIAMYRAKEEGRNTYEFYAVEMNAGRAGRLEMEILLRHALERHEFVLHYQPIAAVDDGRITGVEALIRWISPELGLVSPGQFIPLAEETGLIVPIGEWVLMTACAQAKAWLNHGFKPFMVSVNLSPRQFRQKNLVEMVTGVLEKSGLDANFLNLEITEGVIMHRPDQAVGVLERLHQLGVQLSIDDFGTGYSSLSYLKRFPVQKLKIDRSFVHDITTDDDDASIVTAIVAMAKGLGLEVVAEGVETPEQLTFLARLRCNEYQGFLFGRPIPARDFTQLLEASARRAAPIVASCEP